MHDIILLAVPVLAEHIIGAHAKRFGLGKAPAAFADPFDEIGPGIQPERVDKITPDLGEAVKVKAGQLDKVDAGDEVGIRGPRHDVYFVSQFLQGLAEITDIDTLSSGILVGPVAQ